MRFGLDGFIDPLQLAAMTQDLDKLVLSKAGAHLVKVQSVDDLGHSFELTGFHFGTHDLVITAGHASQVPQPDQPGQTRPAAQYKITSPEGKVEDATEVGRPNLNFDCMVLQRASTGSVLYSAVASPGDTVYVLGFPPGSLKPAVSKGMVSTRAASTFQVLAHAAHGWSGGLVVNFRSEVVGMVKGGTNEMVVRLNAVDLSAMNVVLGECTEGKTSFATR